VDSAKRQREALSIARQVRDRPPHARVESIEALCRGDIDLRTAVERLLAMEADATVVRGPEVKAPPATPFASSPNLTPASTSEPHSRPRRIGSYRLLQVLGEGGMGSVYLAEQDKPRRPVALKLIRPGLMNARMLRRFEHESEMLARLQHPGIAQVYEAGTAETGDGPQPFFAMEYIRGQSLTEFCRERQLSTRDRLSLFTKVCDAVQHAHQQGVIHRDLKPANILVQADASAPDPAGTQPKVLDFGIARSTESDIAGASMQTEAGQLIGTVPYMSPEQISGDPRAIDTRSDVYTLGVILYELLAGTLPHRVSDKTLPEAIRTISTDEPPPLGSLNRALAGDVQTIVGKAMEKDRARRYQSASELANDIHRFLRHEPILARPPSRAYLFRKFAARNRALVAGAAFGTLALVIGSLATATQAVRASRERDRAQIEADFAKSANEFLTSMLSAANPDNDNARELTVREMLDRAEESLARDEAAGTTRPRVAMSLHSTLSSTYRALGYPEKAVEQARKAEAKAIAIYGEGHLDVLDARRTLALALSESGDLVRSEQLTRECLATLEQRLGPAHVECARARGELGRVLLESGRIVEAEPLLRSAVDQLTRSLGERHAEVLTNMDHLGLVLQRLAKFEEAEHIERKGLAIRREVFGPESTVTAFSLNNLANIAQKLGRHEEAVDLLRQALSIRRAKLDPNHPSLLVAMTNLAVAVTGLGHLDEAEPLLREAAELQSRRLGPEHPKTLSALGNLAYVLEDQGKLDEAERVFRQVVDIRRRGAMTDQDTWGQFNNLAMLLQKKGHAAEAEAIYREFLPKCESGLPPDHYILAIFRSNFGDCLCDARKFDEAEAMLLRAQPALETFFKVPHPRVIKNWTRLAKLYDAWGKPEQAAAYRTRLQEPSK
jgi:serine/threonine protein kinase/Tfp pilus assembly protein PilF